MPGLPIPRFFWPITIDTTNDKFVVNANFGGGAADYTGTLAHDTYLTPELLIAEINDEMSVGTDVPGGIDGAGGTFQMSIDEATGVLTIVVESITAGNLTLKFATSAVTQALGTLLGFGTANLAAVPVAQIATRVAAAQLPNFWTPDVTPRSDTEAELELAVSVARTAGGQSKHTRWGSVTTRSLRFEFLTPRKTLTASEVTPNEALQRFWTGDGVARFRYSPDRTDPATGAGDYFLLEESARRFKPVRLNEQLQVYSIDVLMGAYNA